MPPHWVARLTEELPNLRAAVTWLLDHGEATQVLRLLAATEDYWTQQIAEMWNCADGWRPRWPRRRMLLPRTG